MLTSLPCMTACDADDIQFSRDVLPVLSENCFFCHGPDEENRQADLRIDTEEGVAAALDRSDLASSELLNRILSTDPDLVMPPRDSNRKLSSQEKEALQKWVNGGANWGGHWAFEPLVAPKVPSSSFDDFPVRNPIDAFVQQTLKQKQLMPSEEATRGALLRRVHLDLTGLPPSVPEVERFLTDDSEDAYVAAIDRLLASPAYGERMAWDWLDAARYADTNGYQGDRERTMWPWRDWVIDAFNSNMPFDQFTTLQLAGDLLPNATPEQKLATGFCRNYMINGEGGRIAEENRVDYVMDMSETMGTVWLGLTLNCCRCHDHKYDPLTQEDYYQFFAFFNQTSVTGGGGDPQTAPNIAVPQADQKRRLTDAWQEIAEIQKQKQAIQVSASPGLAAWEKEILAGSSTGDWQLRQPTEAAAKNQALRILNDASVLAEGQTSKTDTYTVKYELDEGTIASAQLDILQHKSLTENGLSRSGSGNFVLTEVECFIINNEGRRPLKIDSAGATFEQGSLKIASTFDGNPSTGWAVWNGRNVDREHAAVLHFAEKVQVSPDDMLEVVLRQESTHDFHTIGRFRLSTSPRARAEVRAGGASLPAMLRVPAAERSKQQHASILEAYLKTNDNFAELLRREAQLNKTAASIQKAAPKVMVMDHRKDWRPTFVLNRGLYNDVTDREVTTTTPASLPSFRTSEERMDRLDLANWLLADDQPLTARVTVNRYWQMFFGIGLVKTTEDFGVQAEYPEHKDLLDWLAVDFRSNGWDVKRLVRQIVTSHTYRQSSVVRDSLISDDSGQPLSLAEVDPENRLLARASRFRMPSWMLRDHALAVSGLLNDNVGGPPINTYQPEGVWEEATFGKKKYVQDKGDKIYRRSLYIFWRRIIAPTMFFDNASRQLCTVKSLRTNTPLHSLLTLNEVTYVESARHLAQTLLANKSLASDRDRLQTAFMTILSRKPGDAEEQILLSGLRRSLAEYSAAPEAAKELLSVGDSIRNKTVDLASHAAWTAACLTIINTDEALTRE